MLGSVRRCAESAPARAVVHQGQPCSALDRIHDVHGLLRLRRRPFGLRAAPPHLSEPAARVAAYGDPWTCRTSAEVLRDALQQHRIATVVDHVVPSFFAWPGEALRVAYHYFVVDRCDDANLLIDPTIFANGLAKDPARIVVRMLATRLAPRMGFAPSVVASLCDAIAAQAPSGLLVLEDPRQIALFRATVCALALGGNPALPVRLR